MNQLPSNHGECLCNLCSVSRVKREKRIVQLEEKVKKLEEQMQFLLKCKAR